MLERIAHRTDRWTHRLRGDAASRRLRGDGGSALVEAALVVPFLAMVLFGTIEYGNTYVKANVVERAASGGARVDSQQANGRSADFEGVRSVASTLTGISNKTVLRVIIFNPDANGNMTTGCKNTTVAVTNTTKAGVAGQCNVYSQAQINEPNPNVGFTGSPGCNGTAWDGNYCPSTRCSSQVNATNGCTGTNPSAVGVFVEVKVDALSRFYGASFTVSKQAYYLLEPTSVGSS